MASPKLFAKMNAGFSDLPLASGENVFTAVEYGEALGLRPGSGQVQSRLRRLLNEGKVRKVRTRLNGTTIRAWQYLGT